MSRAGETMTFGYDGDGTRLTAATGADASQVTRFVWDRNAAVAQLVRESNGTGGLQHPLCAMH